MSFRQQLQLHEEPLLIFDLYLPWVTVCLCLHVICWRTGWGSFRSTQTGSNWMRASQSFSLPSMLRRSTPERYHHHERTLFWLILPHPSSLHQSHPPSSVSFISNTTELELLTVIISFLGLLFSASCGFLDVCRKTCPSKRVGSSTQCGWCWCTELSH